MDVSNEIPEFLTSLSTSVIYTFDKVGKGTVTTIVSSLAMSEHDFCRPALIVHSAWHRTSKARSTCKNFRCHTWFNLPRRAISKWTCAYG
jgi:hypothetical protein